MSPPLPSVPLHHPDSTTTLIPNNNLPSTINSTPPPNRQFSGTAATSRALHPTSIPTTPAPRDPGTLEFMSIENLKTFGEFTPPLPPTTLWSSLKRQRQTFRALRVSLAAESCSVCARINSYLRSGWLSANIPCHTDPFAEADEDTGETKQSQNYIHIRIQREFAFQFIPTYACTV
jgi:hypothetical protein